MILLEHNLYYSSYLFLYNDNRRHQCVILYIRRLNLILLYPSSNMVFYCFSLCDQTNTCFSDCVCHCLLSHATFYLDHLCVLLKRTKCQMFNLCKLVYTSRQIQITLYSLVKWTAYQYTV